MISKDRLGYESMMGLGDPSGLDFYNIFGNTGSDGGGITGALNSSGWFNNMSPIYPTPAPAAVHAGFDWSSIIAPITNAGLKIATNITNPAYNTPGAYTRLPDGTIIATAGKESTGYTSVAPGGMSLNQFGSGISLTGMLPLLAIGAVVLFAMKK